MFTGFMQFQHQALQNSQLVQAAAGYAQVASEQTKRTRRKDKKEGLTLLTDMFTELEQQQMRPQSNGHTQLA